MFTKAKSVIKMPVFKALFTLTIPIIMANLFQSLYQMTDSFWVGRLGGAALAAVSICTPIIFLIVSIGIGFAIAGSTFVAQYFGAQNHKMISHAAAQTVLMIASISLVFSSLGFIFAPKLLLFMGANTEIFDMALGFLRVSFIALIANFFFFIFQSIMRGIGKPSIPVYIVISTVLLNFILDPLFIFGFGPIPATGPMGAALATLLTQTIAFVAGFIILFGGRHGIHLKISDFKPDFTFIKKAFKIGLPSSIEQSSRNLVMVFMTSLIAGFGTTAIASYGAGSIVIQVAIMVSIGLAVANGTLVGQNIGANDIRQASRVVKLSSFIGFTTLSLIGLILFIFSRQFISFFVPSDLAVIEGGIHFVKIVSLSFGFISLHMIFSNVFTATGKTTTTMLLTIL
jgi:putative MATE family efflux protein